MTDVHQSAVVHADIDKAAEIDDVEDRAGQFHAIGEVLEFEHAVFENGRRQIFAGIASGPGKMGQDVFQAERAHV